MRAHFISSRRPTAAFTLMELLIVIAIMALLASLTMMGFRSAQINASRSRTAAFHKAIMSGLENYHSENGEYPEPRSAGQMTIYGNKKFDISGALMLYQAMSGDGDDQIKSGDGTNRKRSNGKVESDEEIANIMLKEMPREMAQKTSNDEWLIMDGFGHPFQYTYPKRSANDTGSGGPSINTINTTYDLWSYAEEEKDTQQTSLEAKQDVKVSGKWIKNW